jgi:hypothetical protein
MVYPPLLEKIFIELNKLQANLTQRFCLFR